MALTEAYIYRSHLSHNLRVLKEYSKVGLCVALKANAYGHGALEVAKTASAVGVNTFGLSRLSEAIQLDDSGLNTRIIMFSALANDEIPEAIRRGFELFVSDGEYLEYIENAAKKLNKKHGANEYVKARIHIKVDTGMRRLGVLPETAVELAQKAVDSVSLDIAGICTHFAVADKPKNPFTVEQINRFSSVLEELDRRGIKYRDAHAANSGGIFYYPEARFSMTRPGISVYGYPPDDQDGSLGLLPVMELRSRVVQVKKIGKGEAVSYGLTQAPQKDTYIAVIAIGYGDGYNRLLSSKGAFAINGTSYPVIGRVCMDQCLVDVGPECRVRRGDTAIAFGPQKPSLTAADIAGITETISYEVTCGINSRVPRVYID